MNLSISVLERIIYFYTANEHQASPAIDRINAIILQLPLLLPLK